MNIIVDIVFIFGILSLGTYLLVLSKNKYHEYRQLQSEKQQLSLEIFKLKQKLIADEREVSALQSKSENLYNSILEKNKIISDLNQTAKIKKEDIQYQLQKFSELFKDRCTFGLADYEQRIEQEYTKIDNNFKVFRDKVTSQIQKYESALKALIENQQRERQKQHQFDTYMIQLSQKEIYDIIQLQKIKKIISKAEVVGKIIWSSYILPKMPSLESRLLPDKSKVVGIYKIQNINDKKIYIGQSKDIATRWRDHIKAGIGATPATIGNKLYAAMSEDGVWAFTFELLEECKQSELNEKEKYWIELYQSNKIGYNTKGGNSK